MAAMLSRIGNLRFGSQFLKLQRELLHCQMHRFHGGLHDPYYTERGFHSPSTGSQGYTIRQGRRQDIPGMFKLVSEAGWNHTIEYLQLPFDCFPEGVFVAESADGEIISQCAALPLDDKTGFMSYYITNKSFNKRGIGRQVFNLSLKSLGNRNVGGNAVWELQEKYAGGDFKIATLTLQVCEFPIKNIVQSQRESACKIVDIRDVEVGMIKEFDKKIHPIPRDQVLKWTLGFATVGRVAIAGDEIQGWGALCKGSRGYRLMPLYSNTPDVAADIAHDLLTQVAEEQEAEIEICFPEDNIEARNLFWTLGAFDGDNKVSKQKRMFTHHDVPVPSRLVYSVMNYEQVLA